MACYKEQKPLPPKPRGWNSSLPAARKPMARGGSITRHTPMKKRNAKRRASQFARCYHSRERVRFVKSLGCCIRHVAPCRPKDPIDNAHTEKDGKGIKGPYQSIAPLCRSHHRRYDEYTLPGEWRVLVEQAAVEVETLWQHHHGDIADAA